MSVACHDTKAHLVVVFVYACQSVGYHSSSCCFCMQTTPSRIVLVASLAHKFGGLSLTDLNWQKRKYSAWKAYGASKTQNVLHALHLSHM